MVTIRVQIGTTYKTIYVSKLGLDTISLAQLCGFNNQQRLYWKIWALKEVKTNRQILFKVGDERIGIIEHHKLVDGEEYEILYYGLCF